MIEQTSEKCCGELIFILKDTERLPWEEKEMCMHSPDLYTAPLFLCSHSSSTEKLYHRHFYQQNAGPEYF